MCYAWQFGEVAGGVVALRRTWRSGRERDHGEEVRCLTSAEAQPLWYTLTVPIRHVSGCAKKYICAYRYTLAICPGNLPGPVSSASFKDRRDRLNPPSPRPYRGWHGMGKRLNQSFQFDNYQFENPPSAIAAPRLLDLNGGTAWETREGNPRMQFWISIRCRLAIRSIISQKDSFAKSGDGTIPPTRPALSRSPWFSLAPRSKI